MQAIHIAIHKASKQAFMFASKIIPQTNSNNRRFKFWPINSYMEKIGNVKMVKWSGDYNNQAEELQKHLGMDWRVLTQYELLQFAAFGAEVAKVGGMYSPDHSARYDIFRKSQGYKNLDEII